MCNLAQLNSHTHTRARVGLVAADPDNGLIEKSKEAGGNAQGTVLMAY